MRNYQPIIKLYLNKMDYFINTEINKINNIQNLYISLLTPTNINLPHFTYHLKNINHYMDLLEEQFEELNLYITSNQHLPICKEQEERCVNFNERKQLFNKLCIDYAESILKS
jgi:hypothetical protein